MDDKGTDTDGELEETLPEGYKVEWQSSQDGILSVPAGEQLWVRRIAFPDRVVYMLSGKMGEHDTLKSLINTYLN